MVRFPKPTRDNNDEGQALVHVALTLVVLLAFIAMAIDGGNVYAERRRMQNAADAGALAGARELCLKNGSSAAIAKAQEYMILNGVLAADIQPGDITVTDNVVDTIARESAGTFFAGLVGFSTVNVVAEAAAACGAATTGCGFWPIAFDIDQWGQLGCGEQFVVWNSENEQQELVCDADGDSDSSDICDCYDCDTDDDGDQDFIVLTGTARGWIDFSDVLAEPYTDKCQAEGCGAAELVCRIDSDSGARLDLSGGGICIPGIKGVKAGAKDNVDARAGDAVNIALYERGIDCSADSNCSGTEADTYWVTQFGCTTVDGWDQNFRLDPLDIYSGTLSTERSKAILVSRNCDNACTTSCGSTDGSTPVPGGLTAVSLIK